MGAFNEDINPLIDAVVRQTVVLVAHLATLGGRRAPLAQVANKVFLGLVEELQAQGINQKVTADMFGLALRTYQRKRQRMLESATERGRSLWEAILTQLEGSPGGMTRAALLGHFRYDEEAIVRGILSDLADTGLVSVDGHGHNALYRSTSGAERAQLSADEAIEARAALVWVAIYRASPVNRQYLEQQLSSLSVDDLDSALERLCKDNRVRMERGPDGVVRYVSDTYLIPYGSREGWAAAVFDHYQAMVGALCAKLQVGARRSARHDQVGGSTFAFDLPEGHPLEDEVLGQLKEMRERVHALRERVDAHNVGLSDASKGQRRVVVYLGQNVIEDCGDAQGESS